MGDTTTVCQAQARAHMAVGSMKTKLNDVRHRLTCDILSILNMNMPTDMHECN